MIRAIELNYPSDSKDLFESIRHLPWPLFLHSSSQHLDMGRYDILTAAPRYKVTAENGSLKLTDAEGVVVKEASNADPFEFLRQVFSAWKRDLGWSTASMPFINPEAAQPLPGVYGYFGYDLARELEKLPTTAARDVNAAEMAVGFYDTIIVVDHQEKSCQILSTLNEPDARQRLALDDTSRQAANIPFRLTTPFSPDIDKESYLTAYQKVAEYIQAGDCYQINLAQRFSACFEGSPWAAYTKLTKHAPAPYSGFFETDQLTLASLSPEQFIGVTHYQAQTKPIKGTIKRSSNSEEDTLNLYALRNSKKDQAENLMIVDLLRNDFSKTCKPNSVRVEKLFDIESFSNVHHLVSTIKGELKEELDALDLLNHCFPGGSITGAPKIRAMEIIDELEPTRRSLYCGSLGYWDLLGRLDTNILIRSFLFTNEKLYCWAGGGIVADSTAESEYQETFDKVAAFLRILEEL